MRKLEGESRRRGAVVGDAAARRADRAEKAMALTCKAGFSRFGLFREVFFGTVRLFPVLSPAFSVSGCCAKSLSIWVEIWIKNR
jgi:hypothetical protein